MACDVCGRGGCTASFHSIEDQEEAELSPGELRARLRESEADVRQALNDGAIYRRERDEARAALAATVANHELTAASWADANGNTLARAEAAEAELESATTRGRELVQEAEQRAETAERERDELREKLGASDAGYLALEEDFARAVKERDEARARVATLEAECASISAEFDLPPTMRPVEGEIRRMRQTMRECADVADAYRKERDEALAERDAAARALAAPPRNMGETAKQRARAERAEKERDEARAALAEANAQLDAAHQVRRSLERQHKERINICERKEALYQDKRAALRETTNALVAWRDRAERAEAEVARLRRGLDEVYEAACRCEHEEDFAEMQAIYESVKEGKGDG